MASPDPKDRIEVILDDFMVELDGLQEMPNGNQLISAMDEAHKEATSQILELIKEAEVRLKVKHATEMSILDQEIMGLKARLKALENK